MENKNLGMQFDDDDFDTDWDFVNAEPTEDLGNNIENLEDNLEDLEDNLEDLGDTLEGFSEDLEDLGGGIGDSSEDFGGDSESFEDNPEDFGNEMESLENNIEGFGSSSEGFEGDSEDFGNDLESVEEDEQDTDYTAVETTNSFLDDSGNIVVMDNENPEDKKRFQFDMIPIDRISIATERIRKDNNFEALYQSVKSTGLLEPIVVAPTKTEGYYILLHGFRRLQACAKSGMKTVPSIINHRVKTAEIPMLEALYNHHSNYRMKDIDAFIYYLEREKNILNASLIEYLLQLNTGDYNKFKDIKEDDDPDIYGKLLEDQITIAQAYKNLEKRRSKESATEKEVKKTQKAYETASDETSTGMDAVSETGEVAEGEGLSDDEIKELLIDPTKLDEEIEEQSLDQLVQHGKEMEGFEDKQQDWKHRERIDPAIRKAVMSRDNNTCQCCKRGGPDYVDILDLHHIVEVYLGGKDSVENGTTLCLNCHKQVHLYARNELHIPKTKTPDELELSIEQELLAENAGRERQGLSPLEGKGLEDFKEYRRTLYKEEQNKYKRIIYLGNIIREGIQKKNIKLEQFKKEHPIDKLGRQKPGEKNTIA